MVIRTIALHVLLGTLSSAVYADRIAQPDNYSDGIPAANREVTQSGVFIQILGYDENLVNRGTEAVWDGTVEEIDPIKFQSDLAADNTNRVGRPKRRPCRFGSGSQIQTGIASYYGPTGNPTANGERYTGTSMTAAHLTLPMGAKVKVTNLKTGRAIIVRINDRGPYVGGRIIDLSPAAKNALGMSDLGHVRLNCT